ncbi:MAG: hypothetical protein ACJ8G3_12210 [Burkholderiaceae bacterium]
MLKKQPRMIRVRKNICFHISKGHAGTQTGPDSPAAVFDEFGGLNRLGAGVDGLFGPRRMQASQDDCPACPKNCRMNVNEILSA